jgi:hypothetical protein
MKDFQGKEPFVCSGCKDRWCETETSVCVPDTEVYADSTLPNQASVARVLITSTKFDLLRRLCEENDESIQECLERLIEKENFDRHYTYDGLSGKTYQSTCIPHKYI